MMKLIAHRGLLNGPDKDLENKPETIRHAWESGFDCEVDLWKIDDKWFLGHDEPTYETSILFLFNDKTWIHCKNFEALNFLSSHRHTNFNFFWHQKDDFTLTSSGHLWTYPSKELEKNSICVLPENYMDLSDINTLQCMGICSDYVNDIRNYLK